MWLYRLYEFLFDRWTVSILEEIVEDWGYIPAGVYKCEQIPSIIVKYKRTRVKYKLTHKFNGSEKIKIKYLN